MDEIDEWREAKNKMFAAAANAGWEPGDILAEALVHLSAEQVREVTAEIEFPAATRRA